MIKFIEVQPQSLASPILLNVGYIRRVSRSNESLTEIRTDDETFIVKETFESVATRMSSLLSTNNSVSRIKKV